MKYVIKWVAWVLVVIGALNWGLVGFFNFDLVATFLGASSLAARIIYDIVGISAIVLIIFKIMKISAMGTK